MSTTDIEVMNDLEEIGNDKIKLMKKYTDEMDKIIKFHGGNQSDIPVDRDHLYYHLKRKLELLRAAKI